MKYAIDIFWNDAWVVTGQMTAVMAWETCRVMASNFVNAEKAGFDMPTLVDLANAAKGTRFNIKADDGTGRCEITLVCRN